MNEHWTKDQTCPGNCAKETTIALAVQKVAEHESTLAVLSRDINEIKNSLAVLLSKLDGFNPNVVSVQEAKITLLEAKVKDVEDELGKVTADVSISCACSIGQRVLILAACAESVSLRSIYSRMDSVSLSIARCKAGPPNFRSAARLSWRAADRLVRIARL